MENTDTAWKTEGTAIQTVSIFYAWEGIAGKSCKKPTSLEKCAKNKLSVCLSVWVGAVWWQWLPVVSRENSSMIDCVNRNKADFTPSTTVRRKRRSMICGCGTVCVGPVLLPTTHIDVGERKPQV